MKKSARILFILLIMAYFISQSYANASEIWKITSYSASLEECGKTDGITASGRVATPNHTIVVNWLPFGTRLKIDGIPGVFTVEDRGARSLFGSRKNHIRHLDIFMPSYKDALKFGVKYLLVEIVR